MSYSLHANLLTVKLRCGPSSDSTQSKSHQTGPSGSCITKAGFAMGHRPQVHMGPLGCTMWHIIQSSKYQDVVKAPWTSTATNETISQWITSQLCFFIEFPAYQICKQIVSLHDGGHFGLTTNYSLDNLKPMEELALGNKLFQIHMCCNASFLCTI